MPFGIVKPVEGKQWREQVIRDASVSVVLLFALMAVCSDRSDVYHDLRDKTLKSPGVGDAVAPIFDLIANPPERRIDGIASVAYAIHQILDPDFIFDAADAFTAMVAIVQMLSGHAIGETVAGAVLGYFRFEWKDILTKRAFAVRNPAATGPFILAAFDKGVSNRAKLANVVLASEAAVRARLSDDLRALIHRIAAPVRKLVEFVEPKRQTAP